MEALRWKDGCLELLDQTQLPKQIIYTKCCGYKEVAEAISCLKVRGAPAIGAAAAYGLVMGAQALKDTEKEVFLTNLEQVATFLAASRPTAINLRWALERLLNKLYNANSAEVTDLKAILLKEAHSIFHEDLANNRRLSDFGQELIPNKANILTHCNTGFLATTGFGTALGVVRAAHEAGKKVHVYAGETRPLLQGARLTAWELMQDQIPVTLITDNMAGYLMACGKANLVIVGADRIAANGDTANKIGTYSLAVLAKEHQLPFYIAAPLSTVDLNIAQGHEIPIEHRDSREVTGFAGKQAAPEGVEAWNPAFDVTPHRLITAIITERGVIFPPYSKNLSRLLQNNISTGPY